MGSRRVPELALVLLAACAEAAAGPRDASEQRIVIGDEYLSAGADAIRAGSYDDGIRLTTLGLARGGVTKRNRAAGLANLCSAYVAKGEPDNAIPYCDRAIALDRGNWRPYSVRAQAYFQKEMFARADADNAAAAAIAPNAAHVQMVRGWLNERLLKPRVIVEEH